MSGTVELIREADSPARPKYTRQAIGTLVAEKAHDCTNVTAADLSRWATAIRSAFSAAFKETWSVVLFTGQANSASWCHWWCDVRLRRSEYRIRGGKYTNAASPSVWTDRFNDYFMREFACQQWVPECEPVRDFLYTKYKDQFKVNIFVVVVRGGRTGGDIIGKSLSHCGHSIWIGPA
jgi:hypothetical protein